MKHENERQSYRDVQKPEKLLRRIRDIYIEIIRALFLGERAGQQISVYNRKVDQVADRRFGLKGRQFVHAALNELKTHFGRLRLNAKGRILNAREIGAHFEALWRIMSNNVDLFLVYDAAQIDSSRLPLSPSYKEQFRKIIERDETAAILLVTHPPEETAVEIRRVTEQHLHGLSSLWADERFQKTSDIRDSLRHYLQHATVRVLCTGIDPGVLKITASINRHLEVHGGFEDRHWLRLVEGVAQDEKKKSLKQALGVCVPIVAVIKIVEHVLPRVLHAVGGMLDDLFGAIIPDVSQSMGDSSLPVKERIRNAWPVLKGGLVTLPLAFGLGWFSSLLYGMSESTLLRMLAGDIFALACCAGTLGTSIAAFRKAYRAVEKLAHDETHAYLVAGLDEYERGKLAFKEAIMDVPFRVGHTLIGVPFQVLLGIAAGAFGFFHNSIFIMVEGMAETLLGAATAFAYPWIARLLRNRRLRRTKFIP